MGKGDKRSRRGKIFAGSYGKTGRKERNQRLNRLKKDGQKKAK